MPESPSILLQSSSVSNAVVGMDVIAGIGYHQAECISSGDININIPDFRATAQNATVVALSPCLIAADIQTEYDRTPILNGVFHPTGSLETGQAANQRELRESAPSNGLLTRMYENSG